MGSKIHKSTGTKKSSPGQVSFVKSAVLAIDYPQSHLREVAFIGRSNAGKSSLINAIVKCQIAKVSGTPGKTRLINFFNVGGKYQLVDLPGYGFAKVSQGEQENWKEMIETYLSLRGPLLALILVMDIRRNWSDQEAQLVKWVESLGRKGLVVLNKADKLNLSNRVKSIRSVEKMVNWPIISCSCLKKTGIQEVKKQIQEWVKEES